HAFGVPVASARVVFIVLTFIHFLGPLAYGALWLVIPFAPGEPSLFERGLRAARDLITRLFGRWPVVPGGPLALIELQPLRDGDRRRADRSGGCRRPGRSRRALPPLRAAA